MEKEFSKSAKRRGTKKFLLARGIKMSEMKDFLIKFFLKYGHTNVEDKKIEELLDLGSVYFISLKRYTYGLQKESR